MKIGVYGSAAGEIQDTVKANARAIGRRIAELGHTLITGGCPGLPYEAVLGAYDIKGKCIGFSPAVDMGEHYERYHFPITGFAELVYVPRNYPHAGNDHTDNDQMCKKYRNIESVGAVQAAIIISGRMGTMDEFILAYEFGKNIGILEGSGGTNELIPELVLKAAKASKSKIIREANPVLLVDRLVKL